MYNELTGKVFIDDIQQQSNYYIKEQEGYQYAFSFFKDAVCPIINMLVPSNMIMLRDDILPIMFFNKLEVIIQAMKTGQKGYVPAGFSYYEKQSLIRVGLDCDDSILSEKEKKSIRHEIIHYALWVVDKPFEDETLEFWCLCYVLKGHAYKKLDEANSEKYKDFQQIYKKINRKRTIYNWQKNVLVGMLIKDISSKKAEELEQEVKDAINSFKKMKSGPLAI